MAFWLPVSDERLPLIRFPVHVLERVLGRARLPAEQHHDGVGLGRNEAEDEDVLDAAAVAVQDGFAQKAVFVQGHLLQ